MKTKEVRSRNPCYFLSFVYYTLCNDALKVTFSGVHETRRRRRTTLSHRSQPNSGASECRQLCGANYKRNAFDHFFLLRAKEPDQPNPNLTRTLHAWGQLDSILDPEDPTQPEIGFKLGSFGFYCKGTIFMLNPILNPFSGQSNPTRVFQTEGPTRPDGTLK